MGGSVGSPAKAPEEILPLMLEFLNVQSLARLRRSSNRADFQQVVYLALLRRAALELLEKTTFPFTHAAYVLGLNGQYYSCDTVAERHYGIPKELPPTICRLFRLEVPGATFTTIRIQKLAAAANFGGKHRTLAFSLACPTEAPPEGGAGGASEQECRLGHALCLSGGCYGGRGEVCEDIGDGSWRLLAKPSSTARWTAFPRQSWLQWHWPRRGDLYSIIVTCEPPPQKGRLTRRDRQQMADIGFLLPLNLFGEDPPGAEEPLSPRANLAAPVRRSDAALAQARRILRLEPDVEPSAAEVDDAFRRVVRAVHPDRGVGAAADMSLALGVETAGVRSPTRGWAMAQLTWARKALREAALAGAPDVQEGAPQPQQELLMLAAPVPEGPDGV